MSDRYDVRVTSEDFGRRVSIYVLDRQIKAWLVGEWHGEAAAEGERGAPFMAVSTTPGGNRSVDVVELFTEIANKLLEAADTVEREKLAINKPTRSLRKAFEEGASSGSAHDRET